MENKRDQSKNPSAPQKPAQPQQQPNKTQQHPNSKTAPTQQKKPGSSW